MKSRELTADLLSCPLFEDFTAAELRPLFPFLRLQYCDYRRGETVIQEGAPLTRISIVVSGKFPVYSGVISGQRHLIKITTAGEAIGSQEFQMDRNSVIYSHTCSQPGTLLWFDPQILLTGDGTQAGHLRTLLFRRNMSRLVTRSLAQMYAYSDMLAVSPLRDRIMVFFERMRDAQHNETVILDMNRTQLSEYLASDRSSFSRELHRLEKAGRLILVSEHEYILPKRSGEGCPLN